MTDPIGNLEEFWAKDIVYRLRIADGDSSDTQYHLDAEAADEIEQLRDALGQIAAEIRDRAFIYWGDGPDSFYNMARQDFLKLADRIDPATKGTNA